MTVWELMQELMQYKPEDEVVIEVVGDNVQGELDSVNSDRSEGCISFDKVSDIMTLHDKLVLASQDMDTEANGGVAF